MNERCPEDGRFMGHIGGDYWSCTFGGKVWRIIYSKNGARIASEIAPSPPIVDKISNRELMERIAGKLGVSLEV